MHDGRYDRTGAHEEPVLPTDPHSCARPDQARVTHLALDLTVDFDRHILFGVATLTLACVPAARELRLDTRDLDIAAIHLDDDDQPAAWTHEDERLHLGRALSIPLRADCRSVRIRYATRPGAAALQWLTPAQTGSEQPFLFSQSQAILARTWVPCQDTPGVRMTYEATLRVPRHLLALMSAENPTALEPDGVYRFRLDRPVPSYLLAVAVGDLRFRALGPRTGVYGQPGVVDRAAWEFAETEGMVTAAENLFGAYRWGRFDLLVLPPSFPFGGMENPRLTFATPTLLAGDRSLVSVIAHELAHSWSGNLVTNATWNDFWLNEGFTNYFESRIMETLHGRERSELQAALQLHSLRRTVAEMGTDNPDTRLHVDLSERDPDDGVNDIAYEKGFFFVRMLEQRAGRERFDSFLREYFDHFAFQSIDTDRFVRHLRARLLDADPELAASARIADWIERPGLPADLREPQTAALEQVAGEAARLEAGTRPEDLATAGWITQQWLLFLDALAPGLDAPRMTELDRAFGISASGNAELLATWLRLAIRHQYRAADPVLERFLTSVGRRKLIVPLYKELATSTAGLARARSIYRQARPGLHALAVGTLDELLGAPTEA